MYEIVLHRVQTISWSTCGWLVNIIEISAEGVTKCINLYYYTEECQCYVNRLIVERFYEGISIVQEEIWIRNSLIKIYNPLG